MNIVEQIASESPGIEEVHSIDAETFRKNYFSKDRPVLIKGFASQWGATRNWDLDFLLNLEGDNDVMVLSDNFIQDDNRYRKGTFKAFIEKLKAAERGESVTKDYLTTLDIFKYYPHLTSDIDFSLFEQHTRTNEITAWIGPKGTVSGFHADVANNMYAQIKGKKMFIITSPKNSRNMYPSDKHIYEAVASQVDITNFSAEEFPNFREVKFVKAILEPGDVLYLPHKWWHYVQSLDTSISISNFGYTTMGRLTTKFFERAKQSLHKRGYYKPKNCFCCEA